MAFHLPGLDLSGLTQEFVFFAVLVFLTLVFLTIDVFLTVERFAGREFRPASILKGASVGVILGIISVIGAVYLRNTYDILDVGLSGAGFTAFLAAAFAFIALALFIREKFDASDMFFAGSGILLLVIIARPFLPFPPDLSPPASVLLNLGLAAIGELIVVAAVKLTGREKR